MSLEPDDSAHPHVQTERVFASLAAYQHALSSHVDWLQAWYSSVLNWDDQARPGPAADHCRFTDWFDGAGQSVMATYPSFAELGQLHRDIHFKAEQITGRAAGGHTVTTSDYEAMMALVLAFSTTAQGLERDAWRTLATVDALTGLGNRQTMMSHLIGERDRSIRLGQPCCIGLVDIDLFKRVNDTFGHSVGDRVLRAVAECLRHTVRPYDVLYRYGGEEFLVCLPAASQEAGLQVLERMRAAIAALDLATAGGQPVPVTATFGLAELSADLSVEESLDRADTALYDGKRAGRNRVTAWNGG
ncbi:diguanylate cyclase [Paramagnetospirillum caucaseum]|uniref:diguanylate cyclase n=1 Tax=Paramagnetospirillum caucaseum TaxID=1244869 RepID=M2Z978_9PROT|nr:diguanylate cyclase [Paramagnetospirillum caucaseum]EME70920.1 diguanylate cyclase [Paramagnetospirillum caucaseum]